VSKVNTTPKLLTFDSVLKIGFTETYTGEQTVNQNHNMSRGRADRSISSEYAFRLIKIEQAILAALIANLFKHSNIYSNIPIL